MYHVKGDPHEDTNLAGLKKYEDQLRILHANLQEKMNSAGTAPMGIPLVSPRLEAEAKRTGDSSLIPDPHWPTVEQAVEESRKQRRRPRPNFAKLAEKSEKRGFWMPQAQR